MTQSSKEYVIPFVGLKLGVHEFEFDVADKFFEGIEYSLIQKGNVKVHLSLEKKETMLIGEYKIQGTVGTLCDLCDDPVDVEIEGEYRLIYKFDTEPSNDETLIIVYPEEFEIDVKENILELITVSMPSRALHVEGECNEEMIEVLSEYKVELLDEQDDDFDDTEDSWDEQDDEQIEQEDELDEDGEIDPRWAALKNLKKDEDPDSK